MLIPYSLTFHWTKPLIFVLIVCTRMMRIPLKSQRMFFPKDCPHSLKPVFYRRYVDDVFVLFSSLDQAEKFKKYLSSKHPNINFSLEKENEGRLSFLDVNIFREEGKFVTNVYRKKTFSGVYTNFDSFIPETYKTGFCCSDASICARTL